MIQISVIPSGLCRAFIHCFSTCANSLFIDKKPPTSTCACSGAEFDCNSVATLNVYCKHEKHYIYLSKMLLYNTANFWHQVSRGKVNQ